MNIKVVKEIQPEPKEMRVAFCEKLIEIASNNSDIVVMDADLMGAMGTKPFQTQFPEKTIDCGIQEANMIGVAAGLSVVGKVPFVHTFGPFMSRRACDQIFLSGAYAKSSIKLVGSDPGITAQTNGGTHMPFEDMGIMRCIPEMIIMEPTDITMLNYVMQYMSENYGMQYMRLVRKQCMKIYQEGSTFKVGKAVTLREGKDVTIIASGFCIAESLKAAQSLSTQGIQAKVIDMFTWKPIDEQAIIQAAEETGAIVSAENHNITTGLGAAISEVVVKNHPVPMEIIGIYDQFGQVGDLNFLANFYHISAKDIELAALKVIARKNK